MHERPDGGMILGYCNYTPQVPASTYATLCLIIDGKPDERLQRRSSKNKHLNLAGKLQWRSRAIKISCSVFYIMTTLLLAGFPGLVFTDFEYYENIGLLIRDWYRCFDAKFGLVYTITWRKISKKSSPENLQEKRCIGFSTCSLS